MAQESKMGTILRTALELAGDNNGVVTSDALSIALGIKTRLEHKRLLNVLSELHLAGRLRRIETGRYSAPMWQPKPDRRQRMWRILKMRRRVQVDDLVEMAEVSRDYAKEWLRMLVKQGAVIKHQDPGGKGTWQLLGDLTTMPEDTDKASRLRAIRKRQKQQLLAGCKSIHEGLSTIIKVLTTEEEA